MELRKNRPEASPKHEDNAELNDIFYGFFFFFPPPKNVSHAIVFL
jgi:hypothetical protein